MAVQSKEALEAQKIKQSSKKTGESKPLGTLKAVNFLATMLQHDAFCKVVAQQAFDQALLLL